MDNDIVKKNEELQKLEDAIDTWLVIPFYLKGLFLFFGIVCFFLLTMFKDFLVLSGVMLAVWLLVWAVCELRIKILEKRFSKVFHELEKENQK